VRCDVIKKNVIEVLNFFKFLNIYAPLSVFVEEEQEEV
jgi:hypothetical protein